MATLTDARPCYQRLEYAFDRALTLHDQQQRALLQTTAVLRQAQDALSALQSLRAQFDAAIITVASHSGLLNETSAVRDEWHPFGTENGGARSPDR